MVLNELCVRQPHTLAIVLLLVAGILLLVFLRERGERGGREGGRGEGGRGGVSEEVILERGGKEALVTRETSLYMLVILLHSYTLTMAGHIVSVR